jgi:hypothetical protein
VALETRAAGSKTPARILGGFDERVVRGREKEPAAAGIPTAERTRRSGNLDEA